MTREIQLRIKLLRHRLISSARNAAPSHGAENNEDPVGATAEQEEQDNGQVNPHKQAPPNDADDDSYRPLSEDEESLGNKDFIMPKAPLEQERFNAS